MAHGRSGLLVVLALGAAAVRVFPRGGFAAAMLPAGARPRHAGLAEALRAGTPLQKLRALVHKSLENTEQQGALFAVFVERGAIAEYDIERIAGKLAQQEYQRFLDTIAEVLQEAVAAGELRENVSIPTMVGALSGALNGVTYAWFRRRRRGRLSAVADDLLELFLAGARK